MRAQVGPSGLLLIGFAVVGFGCDGTMNTGTAQRPVNNKPGADGNCPTGQSLCGAGVFSICVDLKSDPSHCGACDRACTPGIACQTGMCRQTVCAGAEVPFSSQPATERPSSASPDAPFPFLFPKELLADINGDGRLDLVSWTSVAGVCPTCGIDLTQFRVSLAQPSGGFATPDVYHARLDIQRVSTIDVNADGLTDLSIYSSSYVNSAVSPYAVELWLGQRDGHLKRYDGAGVNGNTVDMGGVELGFDDLSGDGWPDLVLPGPELDYENPPTISIYLSDSMGALHLSQTFVAWSRHTLIRDMNRDGNPDLLLLSESMEILYNRGNGLFEQPVNCALSVGGALATQDLLVDDFNRDGWTDIASNEMFQSHIAVLLGLGGCGFAPIVDYEVPGTSAGFLRTADINGDGVLDIVSVNPVSSPDPTKPFGSPLILTDFVLSVLLGNPDGTFRLQDSIISLGPKQILSVTIAEITGDQRPDIMVSTADTQTVTTSILENTCQ